jgi:hypothetical protein
MKLTELILELRTIMLKEGNLDVYTIQGCGCCDGHAEPEVKMLEDKGLQTNLAKRIINGKPDQWVRRYVTDWEIVDD